MNKDEKDFLKSYDPTVYKRPSVTVDIVICTIHEGVLKVLLIKRKHPPFRDCWAIPGGFVEVDKEETLLDAAHRELQEETGVTGIYVEQLGTYGDPHRDPRTRVITVAHIALVPWERLAGQDIRGMDDAKEAKWFPMERLPKTGFDHINILHDALKRIRGKITYSPIAFELLQDKQAFSWLELQGIFETVLGRKLVSTNLRRKINAMYKIRIQGTRQAAKIAADGTTRGRPEILLMYVGEKATL